MTRSTGLALPDQLVALLDGRDPAGGVGFTVVLATPGADGYPLIALLGVGEVLACGPRDVRLGLWSSSATTAELTRFGAATLSLIHGGSAWDVRLRCERAPDIVVEGGGRLAAFRCRVEEVLEDRVGYAELEHGIRFRLKEPERVLPRWTTMLAALRELDPLA